MWTFHRGLRVKRTLSIYDIAFILALAAKTGGDVNVLATFILDRGLDVDTVIMEIKRFLEAVKE